MIKKTVFGSCVFVLIGIGLGSCVPEAGKPYPYNYIINGPKDTTPAFSPDGERIAYTHFAREIPEPVDYPTGLYVHRPERERPDVGAKRTT